MRATRGRDLSHHQGEAILNRLLADYPEAVFRWCVGLMAEPPEMARAWLLRETAEEGRR